MEGLTQCPPSVMLISEERATELLAASYGDVTSTGRELSDGAPNDSLEDVKKWAESPTPRRSRDIHNNHQNSDKWDLFEMRDNDIVIDTSYKSGTTWTQTIVANLIFNGKIPGWDEPDFPGVMGMSPWIDMRIPPPPALKEMVEAQTHRRFFKSHLPLDALPYNEKVKYIVVVRDVRDVAYSWYNHWHKAREFFLGVFNNIQGLIGPPVPNPEDWTPHRVFEDMLDDNKGSHLWSYYHHIATWWAYKHLPNIKFVHYNNLKKDPKGEIAAIAKFLDIEPTEELINITYEQTTIDYMKLHNQKILGPLEGIFEGGGNSFIHKGTNNRWTGEITPEEEAKVMERYKTRLGDDCTHYILTGEML